MPRRLTQINRFPVKSCGPVPSQRATVEACGLGGDRRWMLVGDDGAQLTAREHPNLLRVRPTERADGGLDLSHRDTADLRVPLPPDERTIAVRIHGSEVSALLADDETNAWLSKIAGVPARLVHLNDTTQRHPNPAFARAADTVSLADAYPILAATTDSLDALNDRIAVGRLADEGPIPMKRFRPNLVIEGGQPWEEDGWRRVRIGAAIFRAVKGCDRCVMTTIDPDSGRHGKEPIATLARHRRWDKRTWFGMQLIPDTPGTQVCVGDEVEILDRVVDPDGPPR